MSEMLSEFMTGLEGSVLLGTVERIDDAGRPWVRLPKRRPAAAQALTSVSPETLRAAHADGLPVLIALAGRSGAVILGVVGPAPVSVEAKVDGKKVTLTGEEEVTLRCGRSSITLTKAGKVLIRGEYVLSRSAGVNRIKGGSVQIN